MFPGNFGAPNFWLTKFSSMETLFDEDFPIWDPWNWLKRRVPPNYENTTIFRRFWLDFNLIIFLRNYCMRAKGPSGYNDIFSVVQLDNLC